MRSLTEDSPTAFGVIFATPQEAGPFRACLSESPDHFPRPWPHARGSAPARPIWQAEAGRNRVFYTISGMGRRAACAAAVGLVEECGVDWLISAGVSGGLRRALPADVVIEVERVLDASGAEWLTRKLFGEDALKGGVICRGVGFCSEHILCTPSTKQEAARQWQADIVDLESAGVAEAADARGVPFSCIRTLSDGAADSLPLDFTSLVDERGMLRYGPLTAAVLARPWTIPALARLGARTNRASRLLARVLVERLKG